MTNLKSQIQTIEKPLWLKLSEKEATALVLDLAKKGNTSEKIGLILRDSYGIPTTRVYGKKVSQILNENGLNKEQDIENLKSNIENLQEHMKTNKHDYPAKRSMIKKLANKKKLTKYYSKKRKTETGNQLAI